jgi:ABC-type lipoprotein export system ATPase subunit
VSTSPFALEARQLCKSYRRGTAAEIRALTDVTLAVPAGAFVVLTGPSGGGKTTLLALLGGLERPTGGHVLVAGRDLSGCSDVGLARVRRTMGFVFQDFALIPGLPVWENITYPLVPRGIPRAERCRLAGDWLTRLDLADKARSDPLELSGGEQQRVAIARALVGRPEIVLADEPTSNLDDAAGNTVLALLQEFHATGKTLVVASHDGRFAKLATAVYSLERGCLARSV